MVVKVRFSQGAQRERRAAKRAAFLSACVGLLLLLDVVCLMLALWRLTSDLGWTHAFIIPDGIWSHWQVWMAMTVVFGALVARLGRYTQAPAPDDSRTR